jgi:UDP-N-acetylglucosamine 1-carboxyvinyltransferase
MVGQERPVDQGNACRQDLRDAAERNVFAALFAALANAHAESDAAGGEARVPSHPVEKLAQSCPTHETIVGGSERRRLDARPGRAETPAGMDKFRIRGGRRLRGEVTVSGAKNAALPCLAAALLTRDPVALEGLPRVRDIVTMERVLQVLGESCEQHDGVTTIVAGEGGPHLAPYELVRTMRASVLVLGPLLARRRRARVALPGGCAIGARPVDFHLAALTGLGADVRVEHGDIVAEAPAGLRGREITFPRITVTGTENLLMAACLARGRTVLYNCACEPEVEDLATLLQAMGARISGVGTAVLEIDGAEALAGARHRVIPDRIETGTYLIAALLAGDGVTLAGCRPEHLAALLSVLGETGAEIEVGADTVFVPPQPPPPRAVSVTTAEHPGFATDLQAQYLALMTQVRGECTVTEAIFENRFQHVLELKRLGAAIEVVDRAAHVSGPAPLEGTTVMASDLRASAALVLAGLVAQGETVVDRIYHLDRGYETMDDKLNALGAQIERFNPGPYR